MLPEFVTGLPLHALVVHFVVALLPLAVAGSIVVALWPAARRRYGWLVVACAAVATILVQVAASSGANLKNQVPATPEIEEHERLGDQLLWWTLPLLITVVALMIVHRQAARQQPDEPAGSSGARESGSEPGGVTVQERTATWVKPATMVIAALTVAAAVGAGIHVYRVGDAGARSVWGFVEEEAQQQ